MKINIINILHRQGRNVAWLAKEINYSYSNLNKLCNNKTTQIKFDTLEKICNKLHVGVEEILIIEDDNGREDWVI